MKCKTLEIKTDGTITGTKVFIDGEQLSLLNKIEFETDGYSLPRILIQKVRLDRDGKPIERILKVRDEKTLKFIEKKTVETDPIVLEFESLTGK
jgi:hypothetical protein